VTLEYGFKENQVLSVPKHFLKYRGSKRQLIVGLGFGPDGLYFVPILPNEEGRSAIFKVIYNPANEHPFNLEEDGDPLALMERKGCFGCHSLNNKGGTSGPPLDRGTMVAKIQARLNSEEYLQSLGELDLLDVEPYRTFKEARMEVLEADGLEKVRIWMKYQIQEPRFDNRFSQMPGMGLSERQALAITDYLLPETGIVDRLVEMWPRLPNPRYRHVLFTFVLGLSLPFLISTLRNLMK
jgi:hypothetical protein